MTLREFINLHAGGLLPYGRVNRSVHLVDGATYRIELTWLRQRIGVDYETSRTPRAVRRARAAEDARVIAEFKRRTTFREEPGRAEKLAAGHRFEVGDIVPTWVREIPAYVLEVCDAQDDVWRRPANDQEAVFEGQGYDWVQVSRANQDEISGYTTNEGLYDWAPVTVTKIAVDTEDANEAA